MAIARLGVAGHQLEEAVVDLLDHLAEEVAGHLSKIPKKIGRASCRERV